jgi:predicted esterase
MGVGSKGVGTGVLLLAWVLGCGQPGVRAASGVGAGGAGGGASGVGGSDFVDPPCHGEPGSYEEQSLAHGGQPRFYFLHVPTSYDCAFGSPVIVDFHGSYGGPVPEQAYAHEELVALSEELGFILVRPRARPSAQHMWDAAPGDVMANQDFVRALLEELGASYHLAPDRIYATGYSSGSNMAATFLLDGDSPFSGIGVLSGALWDPTPLQTRDWDEPPRLYVATGFRDLHRIFTDAMLAELGTYPGERLWERETDAGHVLDVWTYRELWRFFERGERAARGGLASAWTEESSPTTESLLEIEIEGGTRWISDARGRIWRRGVGGYEQTFAAAPPRPLNGLAIGDSGGVATAMDRFAVRSGDDWTWVDIPQPSDGFAYFWAGAGTDGDWLVAGTTSYAGEAEAFAELDLGTYGGVQGVARAESGTYVAVGRFGFVGHRPAGGSFAPASAPVGDVWLNGVTSSPGAFWVAGEGGSLLASFDDGSTFVALESGTTEDLYTVSFFDDMRGAAAGAHGVVVVTADGGETWSDRSTGLDGFIGDIVWVDASTLVAVGEDGFIGRLEP